jgi:RNA polymerase sigma-70 factor (ECF subfamily)
METSLTWLGRLIDSPSIAEWQRLSDVYKPLIGSWVTRAGVAESDKDDLVQEVLMVVVRRVGEFEHQHPGAFRGWLRAILANQLKKYFREHAKLPCLIPLDNICDPTSDESAIYDREHDEYLAARAMRIIEHEFEPATWLAFRLQVIDNRRPADVATEIGISVNAVIKAKCRVLKRLREALSRIID